MKTVLGWLIAVLLIAFVVFSCSSCNNKKSEQPTVPEVIESNTKQVVDSLRNEITVLQDSITYYKKAAAKAEIKKEVAREKVKSAKQQVINAVEKKDTSAIIAEQNNQIQDQEKLIAEQDEQLTAQGNIIQLQEATIKSKGDLITTAELKYATLKQAYADQSEYFEKTKKELVKKDKKLKRAKFFNKVLGVGTAAGVALAALILF